MAIVAGRGEDSIGTTHRGHSTRHLCTKLLGAAMMKWSVLVEAVRD